MLKTKQVCKFRFVDWWGYMTVGSWRNLARNSILGLLFLFVVLPVQAQPSQFSRIQQALLANYDPSEAFVTQLRIQLTTVIERLTRSATRLETVKEIRQLGALVRAKRIVPLVIDESPETLVFGSAGVGYAVVMPRRQILSCGQESDAAHTFIHIAQSQDDPEETPAEEQEWIIPREESASTVEIDYAGNFCQPPDLRAEQRTLLAAYRERSRDFPDLVTLRTPDRETFMDLVSGNVRSPKLLNGEYEKFADRIDTVVTFVGEALSSGRSIGEAFAKVRAVEMASPIVVHLAEETFRNYVLYASRNPAAGLSAERFFATRERLNGLFQRLLTERAAFTRLFTSKSLIIQ